MFIGRWCWKVIRCLIYAYINVAKPTSAVLSKEKSIVFCLSTYNYGTRLLFSLRSTRMLLFSASFYWRSHFFIFTHPPYFLLYLHLCFTPSLSCCLSVMWSRTDAGSPNCGTAISALLWLLGSPSETGLSDAPPSPSASQKKKKKKRREKREQSKRAGHQAISQNSDDPSKISPFSERVASHLQCSREYREPGGLQGKKGFVAKTQVLTHRTVWQISSEAAHLLMCLWWKMLCADFVSSRLEWGLPCVANTVGCWQAAQVWDIGRGVRLWRRSCMIFYCRVTMSHGSGCCSMWLWRTFALPGAQWQYSQAVYDVFYFALVGVTLVMW